MQKYRRTVLMMPLLTATLALGACGGTWSRPGGTAEDWQRDHYECSLQGRQAAAGSSASGIFMQEYDAAAFRNQCLALRGYARQ
jgi:hypothetical protein